MPEVGVAQRILVLPEVDVAQRVLALPEVGVALNRVLLSPGQQQGPWYGKADVRD